MSPRPILKKAATTFAANNHPPEHPVVHFPSSSAVTSTYEVHSPSMYDRSPITVLPNICELPEHGCPGRTYYHGDPERRPTAPGARPQGVAMRNHAHPRLLSRQSMADSTYLHPPLSINPPPLIPDFSSESEESDGFISPLPEPRYQPSPYDKFPSPGAYTGSIYNSHNHTIYPAAAGFAYYPTPQHAPPPIPASVIVPKYPHHSPSSDPQFQRAHRPSRRSRNSSPGSPHRHYEEEDSGYTEDADLPFPSTPTIKSNRRTSAKCSALCANFSQLGFHVGDDAGCLDGF